MTNRKFTILLAATALTLIVLPWFGTSYISPWSMVSDLELQKIIFQMRTPRLVLAFLIGGGLSAIGLAYQCIFKNPIAEPYILGVSTGTMLSISLLELACGHTLTMFAASTTGIVGGLIVALFVIFITFRAREDRVILCGMGTNFILSAIFFIIVSLQLTTGGGALRFLFGQVPWVSWWEVTWVGTLTVLVLAYLVFYSEKIEALAFGDTSARILGIAPLQLRSLVLVATSLWLAPIVTLCGSIGFVGLAVPHLVRLWVGPLDTKSFWISCFLCGGLFLAFCDVLSRLLIPPIEIPVGTITTLLGGPIFVWQMRNRST